MRSPRIEGKRKQKIEEVLVCAAAVFASKGYNKTRLDDVAQPLGLRGPSLYYYFDSKEDLYISCLQYAMDEVYKRLDDLVVAGESPIDTLRLLFCEQTLVVTRDFPEFVPLFLSPVGETELIRHEISRLRKLHGDIFRSVARDAVLAKQIEETKWKERLLMAFGALAYLPDWYVSDANDVEFALGFADDLIWLLHPL